jgi:Uma2 family endonuclease
MAPAYKLLTVDEFLDACPQDQRHYQLIGGVIVAMAPAAGRHQIIAARVTALLVSAVDANLPGCTVRSQAGVAPRGVHGRDHFETDITVTCEPLSATYRGIVQEPLLIVEILSPSTDRDDVFIKLPSYQQIPSLREILYIETEQIGATLYRREATGWTMIERKQPGDVLPLATVGLGLPLSGIYRDIPLL